MLGCSKIHFVHREGINIIKRMLQRINFLYYKIRMNYHQKMLKQKCYCDKNTNFFLTASVNNLSRDIKRIKIGSGCNIRGELFIYPYQGNINIGNDCYVGEGTRIWAEKSIIIGNNVLISHNVDIHDSNDHPIEPKLRHNHYVDICNDGYLSNYNLHSKPINIMDNVWIGFGACILKGVTIGDNSIVAAHAVVVKNVPENVVVAGNPARVVKKLEIEE